MYFHIPHLFPVTKWVVKNRVEDLRVNVYSLYVFLEISERSNLGYRLCGCCENLACICIELFKKWQMRKQRNLCSVDSLIAILF